MLLINPVTPQPIATIDNSSILQQTFQLKQSGIKATKKGPNHRSLKQRYLDSNQENDGDIFPIVRESI